MMRDGLVGLRKQKNISVRKAASEINISPAALSKIENGKYNPSFQVADAIAEFYEVPIEILFPEFRRSSPQKEYSSRK